MCETTPREVSTLLAPCSTAPCVLGNNIAPSNPDVEVLAMLVKDTPATDEGFKQLDKGDRGWVMTSWCVMGVGPPGFSSVPYTHGKKKDAAESKKLYEFDEHGQTRFFSYEVGKTNKDRGARCQVGEIDGEQHDLSVVLRPGMVINEFMRPEKMAEKVLQSDEDPVDVLPAFTLVFLQLGVGNIEQAIKGRMLKFKKMKVVPENAVQSCLYSSYNLPSTETAFRECNNVSVYKSLRECIDTRSNCMIMNRAVSKDAYAVTEGDYDSCVLVNMDSEFDMAHMQKHAITSLLPNADAGDCIKFLNICIACNAVTAVIRTRPLDAVVLNGDGDKYRARVLALTVNYNKLFGLNTLPQLLTDDMDVSCAEGSDEGCIQLGHNAQGSFVLWSKLEKYPESNKTIFFKLCLQDQELDHAMQDTHAFVDKEVRSTFKLLKITMLQKTFAEVFDMYNAAQTEEEEPKSILTLQMRFRNKNSGSTLGKRPRPAMEWE